MATRISVIIQLLVITLCCIGIVEGGYVAFEYLVLLPKVRIETIQPEAFPAPLVGPEQMGKKFGYQIILSRNLFAAVPGNTANRFTVLADNLDALEATSLGIVLIGTIGDNEGGNRAIIVDKKTLEQKIYRQGEGVQGAIIKEIRRGKVILTLAGRDEILDMSEAAKFRPVQKIEAGSETAQSLQDMVRAVLKKNTLAELPAEELHQQYIPRISTEAEKSAKRIIRPLIIRPLRHPVTNR
ncbi:MAG: hypothetical protein KJ630_09920 [Proteobacteria bacterium]|nr:hypothetical protein [Pseudomonadota bacterium]